MRFKQVLIFLIVYADAAIDKKNQYQTRDTNSNLSRDYKLELQLKLNQLELKLKDLEIQNLQIQNTLDEIKNIAKISSNGLPKDCREVQNRISNVSDVYRIRPDPKSASFLVLCDMNTRGGGWAYVLNRYDGSQDFDLGWEDYKRGFGQFSGEFWLGLESLSKLTSGNRAATDRVSELLIEMVDWDLKKVSAHYKYFSVGTEDVSYKLELIGGYSGDAGDSLSQHFGKKFSTKDRDNDHDTSGNCARYRNGGWWYDDCFFSKLTGKHLKGSLTSANQYQGIHWSNFRGISYSLKQARMMVRTKFTDDPIQLGHEKLN